MNYKKLLPYIVALVIFVAINVFYFAPQFRGEHLYQHDVMQYKGMTQDILEHREKYGEDPQWAGNLFGGMPAYMINVKYDGTIIKTASKAFYFLGEPAALIFIAMACFYLMLLLMGVNPWIGIIPSLAYGLSSYFFIIIGAGHITKMVTLGFIPLLFGGIYYTYRRNMWLGAAISGVAAAITVGANHPQIIYYFLFIFFAFWINELIISYKGKTLRRFAKCTALLALAAALAVGSNAAMLYYVSTYSKDTLRGKTELTQKQDAQQASGLDLDYATMWSYGKGETFNLIIPNLYGGSSQGGFSGNGEVAKSLEKYNAREIAKQLPGYWGEQPGTSGPVYIGAVIIFLAILGLFLLPGKMKWWVLTVAVLAIMLAWGKHMMWFTELFFNYFPMYNKFRVVSMILVIVQWCVPVLAALALHKLWTEKIDRPKFMRGLKWTAGITGGIALLFLLFGGMLLSFTGPMDTQMQLPPDVISAMMDERLSMMRADSFRTLIFVLLTGATVWLFYEKKIKKVLFAVILAALVIADLVPVNLRYLSSKDFKATEANIPVMTEADKQILKDKELGYRVFNLAVSPFNDATTSYYHRSVGGYHGAKLQRYQDLIEHHLGKMNMEVINMLNTKYIITPDEKGGVVVQQNPGAHGPAWFVDNVVVVENADEEIDKLGMINTLSTAVVDKRFESQLHGAAVGRYGIAEEDEDEAAERIETDSIWMTDYRVNLLRYGYTAEEPRIAVFSEIYYDKGWTAYIDGEEAPYFRADYVLRAMNLPAGQHTVEFRFRAPNYEILTMITLISSLLLIAGLVAAVAVIIIKKRRSKENSQEKRDN